MHSRSAAIVVLTLCCAAVAGCGSPEPEPPPPVSETVFGDAVGTMDRARAVEDVTREHKQALDQALEAAEGTAQRPAP